MPDTSASDRPNVARIATWNLERKKPTTPTGIAGVQHLESLDADVLVLTESRLSYPAGQGYTVGSQSWGDVDERKVLMWSAQPWTDVDDVGSVDFPPSRFVAATTDTPTGPVRVFGVCISWHMANVQYGNRNRRPWQDHTTYCRALRRLIGEYDRSLPLVVAGDFNQRLSNAKLGTSQRAVEIARAFESIDIVTADPVPGWDRPENDHIAVDGLDPVSVRGWGNVVKGVRCSDHGGVVVDFSIDRPGRGRIRTGHRV